MNIVIFSRPFYPAIGGLERIAQILATEFAIAGQSVEVVTDEAGISAEDDGRFPFRITRVRHFNERVRCFRQADVVLFMGMSLHGVLAAQFSGRPIMLSHHGVYRGRGLLGGLLEFIKRELTRLYPNISVSHFVADDLPGVSMVIPNAYDNALFVQPSKVERERDFVFCGRLVSDKGADVCMEAFAIVLGEFPDASLTYVGDGPETEVLQCMAQRLGVAGQVRYAGFLKGAELVSELLKHACMVIPSLWEEPFGIVALEGIACCDTVIVSQRGGLPEAIGECGLIVVPTVEEIAKAMIDVVRSLRLGEKLPGQPDEKARAQHLAKHAPAVVARQYLEVLQRAVSGTI